jgi:hypothetical protein
VRDTKSAPPAPRNRVLEQLVNRERLKKLFTTTIANQRKGDARSFAFTDAVRATWVEVVKNPQEQTARRQKSSRKEHWHGALERRPFRRRGTLQPSDGPRETTPALPPAFQEAVSPDDVAGSHSALDTAAQSKGGVSSCRGK